MRVRKGSLLRFALLLSFGVTLPAGQTPASSPTLARDSDAPVLGADLVYADWPHPMIEGWRDREQGRAMAKTFEAVGLRSLRFSFHGFYSPLGPEVSEKIKAENKLRNQFPWFPFDHYVEFIAANGFTTVVAVNVEEGPDVAAQVVDKFVQRGISSKLVAIELSNEPWLNHRPWLPEEYAARAAAVIKRLSGKVRLALPLTVGPDRNTPTKLSDNEWVTRMLRALNSHVDLKGRADIYGAIHLYSRGVRAETIQFFNKVARPFMPSVRYLVTEFNIRLGLEGNPHLTNRYAMEFARRLAGLMAEPDIEALYVHGVPYHSIVYWANRRIATVVGHRDRKLNAPQPGWHMTPTGRVYSLYSRLAWNGRRVAFEGSDKTRYWAVESPAGKVVVTVLNDNGDSKTVRARVAGLELNLTAAPRSIACFDRQGELIESLSLSH